MATFTFVDVDLAEAKRLADLSGAATDLESARDLAKYLAGRFTRRADQEGEPARSRVVPSEHQSTVAAIIV